MPKDQDAKFDGTIAGLSGMIFPPRIIASSIMLIFPRPGASQIRTRHRPLPTQLASSQYRRTKSMGGP